MITLHREQQKYWDNRSSYNIVDEPRRWGKTTLLYYVAVDQLSIPGRKVIFLCHSYAMVRYCFDDFQRSTGIEHIPNSRFNVFMPNGSRLMFSHNYEEAYGFHVLLADDVNLIKNYRAPNLEIVWKTYSSDVCIDMKHQQDLLASTYGKH